MPSTNLDFKLYSIWPPWRHPQSWTFSVSTTEELITVFLKIKKKRKRKERPHRWKCRNGKKKQNVKTAKKLHRFSYVIPRDCTPLVVCSFSIHFGPTLVFQTYLRFNKITYLSSFILCSLPEVPVLRLIKF